MKLWSILDSKRIRDDELTGQKYATLALSTVSSLNPEHVVQAKPWLAITKNVL